MFVSKGFCQLSWSSSSSVESSKELVLSSLDISRLSAADEALGRSLGAAPTPSSSSKMSQGLGTRRAGSCGAGARIAARATCWGPARSIGRGILRGICLFGGIRYNHARCHWYQRRQVSFICSGTIQYLTSHIVAERTTSNNKLYSPPTAWGRNYLSK